jgi:excisionase family DNA binding protein
VVRPHVQAYSRLAEVFGEFLVWGGREVGQQILIADEVAEMLRVDRQRVYELARRNAIPVIRLGERQYRFDAGAIRQWIERGGSGATAVRSTIEGEAK